MKRIVLFLLVFTVSVPMFSQDALPGLADYLQSDSETLEKLLDGEEISLFHNQNIVLEYIPQSIYTQKVLGSIRSLEPNMAIEGLFLIPADNPGPEEMLKIVNIFCSVSTLKGIEYYSQSKEKMRILFEESYRVDGTEDSVVLEDLYFDSLPFYADLDLFQKDLTFGSNISSMEIWTDSQGILLEQVNQTPMRLNGIVKVIDQENFRTILLVLPCEEGWLYYGVMAAHTYNVRALINRANESLYNRMNALFVWFIEEYSSN